MPSPARAAALGLLLAACGSDERPPPFQPPADAAPADASVELRDADTSCLEPPTPALPDSNTCDNLLIEAEEERSNLYFALDRSASMSLLLEGSGHSKYEEARIAISTVLQQIGHRVRYGAAVFPSLSVAAGDECLPGGEVFETRAGDATRCIPDNGVGPILTAFLRSLATAGTAGGTPTAALLEEITPTLTALPGRTTLVLATDGAPNCNDQAACAASECTFTIDGWMVGGQLCNDAFNCCDPLLVPRGNLMCVDADATEGAVGRLAAEGIATYVIGMPGSEPYADHLGRLAEVGGTARASLPQYYAVANTADLSTALAEIATRVGLSCEVRLTSPAPDPLLVNVFFDGQVVAFSPDDGWTWADDSHQTVIITGSRCTELQAGDITYVQVMLDCPTYVE